MLRDYLFVDEPRLNSFIEQIGGSKRVSKSTWKVNLSLTPSLEVGGEKTQGALSTHEKIELLVRHLKTAKLLDKARPQEMRDPVKGRFILETMRARKVIIPRVHLQAVPGVRDLAIWVSDPDPSIFVEEFCVWRGTFLYLTELWLDAGEYHTVWSGRSALQAIANAAEGRSLLERGPNPPRGEPLGRDVYAHPIDKLRRVTFDNRDGAGDTFDLAVPLQIIKGDERCITSLYKPRYLTDEQCYVWQGQKRRVNDLVGYPIFIVEGESFCA